MKCTTKFKLVIIVRYEFIIFKANLSDIAIGFVTGDLNQYETAKNIYQYKY